ncbi:hypothetical protein AaE_015017 [Aphanomyces astaci]|uniref:NrS-1 polymerase-like helicase domain-containing protein n=1 Tax=Aphanomyces astaci TaxID=112090 RepID=A0A6A4YXP0_APHAT|nr:hypothetical protein AaE_015017 [Aphanomyces astaci]
MCLQQTTKNSQCKLKNVAGSDYCKKHQPVAVEVVAVDSENEYVSDNDLESDVQLFSNSQTENSATDIIKSEESIEVESIMSPQIIIEQIPLSANELKAMKRGEHQESEYVQKLNVEFAEKYKSELYEDFEMTFCASTRILNDLTKLVGGKGRTIQDFEKAMIDDSFEENELSYWAEAHCNIRNRATNDFTMSYVEFEKILKQLVFSGCMMRRFLCYFINEFFVFGATSSDCWVRAKVTKHNTKPLHQRSINEFKNISIRSSDRNGKISPCDMFSVLKSLPYHKFTNSCHLWNHSPEDRDTFSVALPFQYTDVGEVTEKDLPDLLMYYLKEVICNNDEDAWIWLRSYLANVIHQPDDRTEVMLILYSQEKRVGKSTLKFIIDQIFGETTNMGKVENLSDVFGERGGTAVVGKRVVWFEELTEKKAVFRACMDRMKTAITEKRTTYKPLYQELHETNNTNEYIACTNHLVGVLADRQTVLHVNNKHREDHAFYTKLRSGMNQDGCNKFASYLKQFVTQLPMRIHKTAIYESMLSNGAEGIDTFINGIKSGEIKFQFTQAPKYWYAPKEDLYDRAYIHWCESQGEKPITFNHFKEKFQHYDRDCEYKRIRVGEQQQRLFEFVVPVNWNAPAVIDEFDE